MAKRVHPNQAHSGLWQPKKGDNFDRSTLTAYLDFFEDDLQEATDYRKWINKYAKTPSFKEMVKRADTDIKISETNLNTCRNLLKQAV